MTSKEALESEAAQCEAAGRAWHQYVEPFFIDKEAELFQAFKDINTTEKDDILLIKMQANVLAMLKDHFDSKINTGRMARHQISEIEGK